MKSPLILLVFLTAVIVPQLNRHQAQDAPTYEVQRQVYGIELGSGVNAVAELTYPLGEGTGYPTVLLLHGSGPYDMDATVRRADGEIVSQNFKLIAETLPQQGIAVLRFNKRGVNSDRTIDMEQVGLSTLDQLVADANAIIDGTLPFNDLIDPNALYLYGWSEGAVVAANVAAARDDIAGVIVQGSPNGDLSTVLPYQHLEIGLPYLTDVIDADADGALSLNEIMTIPAGAVQLMPSFYMFAFTSTPENPQFNPQTDINGDGLIQIETELRPAVERTLAMYSQFMPPTEASWNVGELLAEVGVPVLVLHGTMDGWVPLSAGEAIAETVRGAELRTFDGLGHALSETTVLAEDSFGMMADEPINDIATWITEQGE